MRDEGNCQGNVGSLGVCACAVRSISPKKNAQTGFPRCRMLQGTGVWGEGRGVVNRSDLEPRASPQDEGRWVVEQLHVVVIPHSALCSVFFCVAAFFFAFVLSSVCSTLGGGLVPRNFHRSQACGGVGEVQRCGINHTRPHAVHGTQRQGEKMNAHVLKFSRECFVRRLGSLSSPVERQRGGGCTYLKTPPLLSASFFSRWSLGELG